MVRDRRDNESGRWPQRWRYSVARALAFFGCSLAVASLASPAASIPGVSSPAKPVPDSEVVPREVRTAPRRRVSPRFLAHPDRRPGEQEEIEAAPTRLPVGSEIWVDLKSMQHDGRARVVADNPERGLQVEFLVLDRAFKRARHLTHFPEGRARKRILCRRERMRQGRACSAGDGGACSASPDSSPLSVPVFLTHDSPSFRRCALAQLDPERDVALEVGCSAGVLTRELVAKFLRARQPSPALAEDGRQEPATAEAREDTQEAHAARPFLAATDVSVDFLARVCAEHAAVPPDLLGVAYFDVLLSDWARLPDAAGPDAGTPEPGCSTRERVTAVFMDIGGNRAGAQVREALARLLAELPALEVVVVKSEEVFAEQFPGLAEGLLRGPGELGARGLLGAASSASQAKKKLRRDRRLSHGRGTL